MPEIFDQKKKNIKIIMHVIIRDSPANLATVYYENFFSWLYKKYNINIEFKNKIKFKLFIITADVLVYYINFNWEKFFD